MLTLAQLAKILVAHGIGFSSHPDDIEAFEAFVLASVSASGCSVRACRDFLGY